MCGRPTDRVRRRPDLPVRARSRGVLGPAQAPSRMSPSARVGCWKPMKAGRKRAPSVVCTMAIIGGLVHAPTASANGRFPRAQRFIESATDPNLLALYGTYGLIVSSDAGRSWNHICEAATGTYTGEDPLLEILPDGKIVARTEGALVRSGTTWCDWNALLGSTANSVTDITRAESSPTTIFALLGSYAQGQGFSSQFSRSADGGVTWSANTNNLPVIARGLSIDV